MGKRILVGCDGSNTGSFLSKRLISLGYESVCVNNRCDTLRSKLSERNYNCVIIFVSSDNKKIYDFLHEVKKNNKKTLIITAIYGYDDLLYEKLENSYADKCIVISVYFMDVYRRIAEIISEHDKTCFRNEIADFLVEMKFPRYLSGFYYLCTAIEICVTKNQYKKFSAMNMYEEIAERMNVKAPSVERSLRNLATVSVYRNSVAQILKSDNGKKLTNSKMISKMSIMFAKKYQIR